MQGSDLKGYARTSIAGVHNSFVLTLLPHVGEVHGHDPHAHLAAQPVAQFASSCSSRLLQIVMNSGALHGTAQCAQGIADCPKAHPQHPEVDTQGLQAQALLPAGNALRVDAKDVSTGGALPPLSVDDVHMHVTDTLLGLAVTVKGDP